MNKIDKNQNCKRVDLKCKKKLWKSARKTVPVTKSTHDENQDEIEPDCMNSQNFHQLTQNHN